MPIVITEHGIEFNPKRCYFCDDFIATTRCDNCGKYICGMHINKRPGINGENKDLCPNCNNCFIATAAYGTPYAKEIQVLRDFRDTVLLNNLFGRIFVRFYYTISPPIANFISDKKILTASIRFMLRPIIKVLKILKK